MDKEREQRFHYYHALIDTLDRCTSEEFSMSDASITSLLDALFGEEQDSVGVDMVEAARYVPDKKLLALQIAYDYLGRLNNDFGFDYQGPKLERDNPPLFQFLHNLKGAIHRILHEETSQSEEAIKELANATFCYYNLVQWANREGDKQKVTS